MVGSLLMGNKYFLVRELVQAGRSTSGLGLTNGKMGIAIALFRYARLSGEAVCEEIAGELLDEVCERLDYSMPVSFGDGLCGIGWGIEYLVQHGYVEGDTDEILKEIDLCVVRNIHIYGISGLSLQNGIVGLGRYMLIRILPTFVSVDTSSSALLKEYLIYLIDWLEEELKRVDEPVDDLLDFLFELYPTGFYQTKVSDLIEYCRNK